MTTITLPYGGPRVPASAALATLTPRQRDILEMVCDGCTDPEIAEALGIVVSTVKTHLDNIRADFEARNRTHLAVLALRAGIIERTAA